MTTNLTLLGAPISANHMWRSAVAKTGKAFTYMPTDAKNTKLYWQMQARTQWRKDHLQSATDDDIAVVITFFFPNKLRRDIDNYLKVVLDSLTGIVYDDDKQISLITASKQYDPENPRIEISINK